MGCVLCVLCGVGGSETGTGTPSAKETETLVHTHLTHSTELLSINHLPHLLSLHCLVEEGRERKVHIQLGTHVNMMVGLTVCHWLEVFIVLCGVVFLGGSCNPTSWRKDVVIPYLLKEGITYYNPVSPLPLPPPFPPHTWSTHSSK